MSFAMRREFGWIEWLSVGFALIVAHAFLLHVWRYPSCCDADAYVQMGREIAERGLFHKFSGSDLRTYGYPFILSFVLRFAGALHLNFQIVLFAFQFLAYLGACFFLRRALARISDTAARIAFCGLLLDYYVLIYVSESLTESLSLTLTVFSAGCWLEAYRRNLSPWPLLAGSFAVGFAMMVRPANLFLAGAWVAGISLIAIRQRPARMRVLLSATCVLGAAGLPLLPQLANNVLHYGKWTPLIVQDLGRQHEEMGIRNIKYATAVPPIPVATVYYENPLARGFEIDPSSPWHWYMRHPSRGLATLAVHTFNMTDQDLLFTYSRDLEPWYRLPLGVVNHAAVALGLLGLVLLLRRAFSSGKPEVVDAVAVLFLALVSNWGLYASTQVEMRFGLTFLLALFPLAGYTMTRLLETGNSRRIAVSAGSTIYVVSALVFSGWVRDQASLIRGARAARSSYGAVESAIGEIRTSTIPPR